MQSRYIQTLPQQTVAEAFFFVFKPFLIIYGVDTIGNEWLFLRLEENKTVYVDTDYFYTKNLPELLGAMQFVIDFYIQ